MSRLTNNRARALYWLAVLAWCVTFVIMMGLVLGRLVGTTVPFETYMAAASHWWNHQPLYNTHSIHGFQYLPQAAMMYVPIERLGMPESAVIWRAIGWGACAWAVWRLSRHLAPERREACFFLTTALAIAPAVDSLGNGQANLLLVGLMMHAASDLIEHRWWRATVTLTLGLATKPLMIVMILLVWAVYRPLLWRLPLATGLLFAAPFLTRGHCYVLRQYADWIAKLPVSSRPDRLYEDLRGLITTLGWTMPHATYFALRTLAALGVLGLAFRAYRRFSERDASVLIGALAAAYLMLFNPRTQSNTYVMTGFFVSAMAAESWINGRRRWAIAMSLVLLGWYGNSHVMGFPEFWLKPLVCVVYLCMLAWKILSSTSPSTVPGGDSGPQLNEVGMDGAPRTSSRREHSS